MIQPNGYKEAETLELTETVRFGYHGSWGGGRPHRLRGIFIFVSKTV